MVRDRGHQLRQLPFSELGAMASLPSETVIVDGREGTLSVIVESCDDKKLKIVVQGFLCMWLPRIKHVALDGFYKHSDGSTTEMQDVEFYDYD
jgi:hypothetical protein